jgi:hypothetical protein
MLCESVFGRKACGYAVNWSNEKTRGEMLCNSSLEEDCQECIEKKKIQR